MGILQKKLFVVYLYKKEKNDQITKLKKKKWFWRNSNCQLVADKASTITTTPWKQDTRAKIKW